MANSDSKKPKLNESLIYGQNMKTLFLILGSHAPENESDLEIQKSTWLRELLASQDYLVLRGTSANLAHIEANTLYVPVVESYENILEKTILGMKWVLEHKDFDFLIRTNVSTYFPPQIVHEVTSSIGRIEPFFGGFVDKCQSPGEHKNFQEYYVTGTALVMSKATVIEVCKIDWQPYQGWPDDLAISRALRENGILPSSIRRNNLSQSHIFIPAFHIRLKTSFDSSLAGKRMKSVHKYFQAKNFLDQVVQYFLITAREFKYVGKDIKEVSQTITYYLVRLKQLFVKLSRLGK